MTKSALVLVDIQNDYFDGGRWPVARMSDVAANAARLLARFRDDALPVFHIRHEMTFEGAPFFQAGTPGAEIHPSVAPQPREPVIVKGRPNSFQGTALQASLDRVGVSDLVICGAMSQMCIDATARAAADFGYSVTVVADACGAKEQTFDGVEVPADLVHAAIMAPLAMTYARVVSTNAFLEG